ncbi:hypothetical protein KL930_002770 [Ogataea haglerorum]|uniref:Uncharacterized protein n=1 Tax=Ogataea haglerorum TaxID=1937702 RepID=A0AAN6D6J2_9ASCO|nr:uncharacterized protein KL911_002972 [Ogataea haglerorum]KAG7691859.1 hypothetical protein KL915_004922 [Ogataea haglerorum]KAG7692707.1 hypothetical protein KL951_004954 [Ogataea haglerorum]KAG7702926.1 hypothetical protein KL950_005004 [Ogataea haglerorum]KAG7703025.1 hypothetical protein KL914_005030 [Ogataea haglerorum]KAG7718926.1 hypothetical protein KL913_001924 [Ogataea haglerorum]
MTHELYWNNITEKLEGSKHIQIRSVSSNEVRIDITKDLLIMDNAPCHTEHWFLLKCPPLSDQDLNYVDKYHC